MNSQDESKFNLVEEIIGSPKTPVQSSVQKSSPPSDYEVLTPNELDPNSASKLAQKVLEDMRIEKEEFSLSQRTESTPETFEDRRHTVDPISAVIGIDGKAEIFKKSDTFSYYESGKTDREVEDSKLVLSEDPKEARRQKILARLQDEPSPDTIQEVVAMKIDDLKNDLMKGIAKNFSEGQKQLWFPDEKVKIALTDITSDLLDTQRWKDVAQMYKDGEIEDRDLVDYIQLSHLAVCEDVDPMLVLQRQIKRGLEGRHGVKFVSQLIDTTNQVVSKNLSDLVMLLPEEIRPKGYETGLLSGGSEKPPPLMLTGEVSTEGSDNLVIKLDDEVKALANQQFYQNPINTQDYREQLVKAFFAGDIISDRFIEITFEDLKAKLLDPDDYEFDSKRSLIVDAGMEQIFKAEKRTDYTKGPEGKHFVVYSTWLANIFDGFGGTHSDDRGIDKYVVMETITHEQFIELMDLVSKRYFEAIQGRKEFGESVMEWKSHEIIRAEMSHPLYNLDPNKAIKAIRRIYAKLSEQLEFEGFSGDVKRILSSLDLL